MANLLVIDFRRPRFDRRPSVATDHLELMASGDPSPDLAFLVANQWIARLRVAYRAPLLVPLDPMTTTWRMEYLRDDARPLRRRPPLIRARNAGQVKFEGLAAFPGGWQVAAGLGSKYEPPAWATLILEARRLSMTSRDGSIVLAFAAIETLTGEVLPLLKKTKRLPPGLWKWIQDRNNNYLKQPGVDEQLDALMRSLAGISLKDNKVLWTAFQELRKARNSLVHTGAARTLDGKLVTNAVALELVQRADEIVSWIEARLPANLQRPVISGGPVITMTATLGG